MNNDAINILLETFQEFRRRGIPASLFLETRNGEQFGTLRINSQTTKPGTPNTIKKNKSPSTVRRDQQRTIFKLRKGFGSYGFAVISAKRTPYEVIPGSDIDFAK